jgi:syntaxin-binding protein 1
MVLVMDDESTRVISSILTMYDIMERNVSLVEKLSMKRQTFPEMDVVYLITPKIESVRTVLSDFESKSKAKYKNVHLFFLDTV